MTALGACSFGTRHVKMQTAACIVNQVGLNRWLRNAAM